MVVLLENLCMSCFASAVPTIGTERLLFSSLDSADILLSLLKRRST